MAQAEPRCGVDQDGRAVGEIDQFSHVGVPVFRHLPGEVELLFGGQCGGIGGRFLRAPHTAHMM
jgi:hypothetical protein